MICLGYTSEEKQDCVRTYCEDHDIKKVYVLNPVRFRTNYSWQDLEYIDWPEIILYKFFYRLLSEIDETSLIVVDECLHTQNRNDLTYNCMRHFLNQAHHQVVFQHLPIIDNLDDFMILFDFDTRSRWKREKFQECFLNEADLHIHQVEVALTEIPVITDEKTHVLYARKKEALFAELGLKDPHTLPRNLHLIAGKAKLDNLFPDCHYIGRNKRFKLSNLCTYREASYPHSYTIFEWCHNVIDFSSFLCLSQQTEFDVLVSDLKVDRWYFERYQAWIGRLGDAYTAIQP